GELEDVPHDRRAMAIALGQREEDVEPVAAQRAALGETRGDYTGWYNRWQGGGVRTSAPSRHQARGRSPHSRKRKSLITARIGRIAPRRGRLLTPRAKRSKKGACLRRTPRRHERRRRSVQSACSAQSAFKVSDADLAPERRPADTTKPNYGDGAVTGTVP